MMRALLVAVMLAGLGWAGNWFFGAQALRSATQDWAEERREDGATAVWDDLSVRGFPNRYDLTLTEPRFGGSSGELIWSAPFLQLFQLVYDRAHTILVFAPDMSVKTPARRYAIAHDDMRASVVTTGSGPHMLERLALTADAPRVVATTDPGGDFWAAAAGRVSIAVEREPEAARYRLGLDARAVQPPVGWRGSAAEAMGLPEVLDEVTADARIAFADPIADPEDGLAQRPTRLTIDSATAQWGVLRLAVAGDLALSPTGVPSGRVILRARNWRDALRVAVQAQSLPRGLVRQIVSALELLSLAGGNPKTLDIPLDFRRGRVWLGPLPVAEAPRLWRD